MRSAPALLAALLLAPTVVNAAFAPELGPGPEPRAKCPDTPSLVDECGDFMAGDLAFGSTAGIQFAGAALLGPASNNLSYGAARVCLAGLGIAGCSNSGTVTSVGTGLGLQGGPITGSGTVDLRLNGAGGLSKTLGGGANELGIPMGGVTGAMVADGTLTGADVANGTLTGTDIADDSITFFDLANDAVSSARIFDGGVATADLANGAVTASKINVNEVQTRVAGACAQGSAMRFVNGDGTVGCEGFVSSVTVGTGLTGGTITGSGTIALANPTTTTLGGVRSAQCGYAETLTGIDGSGRPQCTVTHSWRMATVPRSNTITEFDSFGLDMTNTQLSATIGADGAMVIAFLDDNGFSGGGNETLRVAKCGNLRCTASNTVALVDDPANNVGWFSSIAIGTDGLPIISYHDDTANALKVAKCGNAACSAGNTITTVDDLPSALNDIQSSIAIGTDGLPVISYYNNSAGTLKFAKCGNAACSAGNTLTTVDDPAHSVGQSSSMAIGSDGLPVVAYVDSTARDLRVLHCGNAACTAGRTVTILDDPAGDEAGTPSLAIAADGMPIVAYRAWGPNTLSLKVLKCGDRVCHAVTNTVTTQDPNGLCLGCAISLAIGADGFPVIAYNGGSALKFAKCGTVGCTGTPSLTTLGGDSSISPAVAIGADGLPIVGYDDTLANPGIIKVAHLGNPYGIPNWSRRG